ncbi:MAG TPA: YncE family protein [Acidimicrobiales bacterium]|nr:YncE family protein [Acidimicrobiales bacterium]
MSGIGTTMYTDAIAHSSVADSLYVAVKSANGMDVVSMSSGTKTANSGGGNLKNPVAVAVTPDGSTAYLANSGANTITPVSTSTDVAGAAVTVGTKPPTGLAITPDGSTVWAADGAANVVTPVAVATNTAGSQINIGFNANAIAITPDGSTAWIAGQTNVISLNLATLTLGTKLTQAGASFQSITITPDGATAYVVDSGNKKVWPLTLATNTFGTGISVSAFTPQSIVMSPDGLTAWVAGQTGVAPVTLSTGTLGTVTTVSGANFQGVAMSPNGCWVYAADASPSNRIVPIYTGTGAAGTSIAVDNSPQGIAAAYPPITYYYEVQATRNLWTSPASGQTSVSFGQAAHSH